MASPSRGGVDRGCGRYTLHVEPAAELLNELLIGLRLGASEHMIYMGGDQPALARRFDRRKSAEQGHAIASAGNRGQHGYVFPVVWQPRLC